MESAAGVPSTLTTIIQGLVVLFLIGKAVLPLIASWLCLRLRATS
jgi:simple sugar transport system permease protein